MSGNRTSLKEFKKQAKSKLTVKNDGDNCLVDFYEKAHSSKNAVRGSTGLVFHEQFEKHDCLWDKNYPENPVRYTSVFNRISEYGLVDRCEKIECREITEEEVLKKHDADHLSLLRKISSIEDEEILEDYAKKYDSVYFNQETYLASMLAAGSGINLVKSILEGKIQNGMAIVRPPGHHAMKSEFCGYCFLNNVALAAQYAMDNHGVKKILVVDWDVHHGQATQQMFYDDDRLVYFSIHRYENGLFWPCLRESNFDYIGQGKGTGFNVNIPLNETGCGDSDYLYIFNNVLLPIAYEYQPELILISAGYDAAIGCPEGRMTVSPMGYSYMTNALMALGSGKVAVFLEGGYFPPSLSEGAALTLGALLGDVPPQATQGTVVKDSVRSSVLNAIYMLKKHWQCFTHYDKLVTEDNQARKHRVEVSFTKGDELVPPFPTRDYYLKNTPEENSKFSVQLEQLKIGSERYISTMKTKVGYCYDPVMLLHKSPKGNNFERPERLVTSINILNDFGLIDRMVQSKGNTASDSELLKVHSKMYLEKLQSLKDNTETDLLTKEKWVTVFSCEESMKSALFAAGSTVKIVDDVIDGVLTSGVALVRPPGHHAEKECAGGFCLLNNVAIAAQHALSKGVERIMILDWDVHHGNGTQDIFLNDSRVLYMSLHRYDDATFYPNSVKGNYVEKGLNPAEGYNVNIAWNGDRMTDSDYITAFLRVVLPIAYEFKPTLLLVSAGFDAAVADPLGGYNLTPEVYGHFVQLLKPTCGGKVVLVLEGGYNCTSVGYSLAMCCKALLGDPLPTLNIGGASTRALATIESTVNTHKEKWTNLQGSVQFEC